MSVGLLGPLLMDGGRAALSPRDRVVLAALGCCPGEAISPESLAEAVWGDEQPASWLKVLQGSVMRLRRAMGSDAIEWTGTGYRLTLAGDELDTAHFERLVARGRSLVAVGEPARAVVAFDEALTLWRGAPFEDLAHWSPGQAAAVRLAEVRRAVEEERLAAALMCGRALELTGQAQLLVTQEPYRENRWALLAQTLYASGRQAEALAAVRHATTTLRDELGLDPSPALAELEQAILRHDPALVERLNPTARSAASCPYKGLAPYEGEDADGFFGREADQSECLRQLGTGRLLVVLGPSGSGKSSLVRAGIVPTLRRAGQRMVLLTPGPRPAEALVQLLPARRAVPGWSSTSSRSCSPADRGLRSPGTSWTG